MPFEMLEGLNLITGHMMLFYTSFVTVWLNVIITHFEPVQRFLSRKIHAMKKFAITFKSGLFIFIGIH